MGKNRQAEISRFKQQRLMDSYREYVFCKLDMFGVSGIKKDRFWRVSEALIQHAENTHVDIYFNDYFIHAGEVNGVHTWTLSPSHVGIYVRHYEEIDKWRSQWLNLPS